MQNLRKSKSRDCLKLVSPRECYNNVTEGWTGRKVTNIEYVKYIPKSKDINNFSHDINSLHLKKVYVKSMAWRNLLGSHSPTACGEEVHEVISEQCQSPQLPTCPQRHRITNTTAQIFILKCSLAINDHILSSTLQTIQARIAYVSTIFLKLLFHDAY